MIRLELLIVLPHTSSQGVVFRGPPLLRNRAITAAVCALLAGGTLYALIRSERLKDELEVSAARAASITGLIARLDSALQVLAIPAARPETVTATY